MRISDWSSDVCSSDLIGKAEAVLLGEGLHVLVGILRIGGGVVGVYAGDADAELLQFPRLCRQPPGDGAHVGAVVAEVDDERALRTRDQIGKAHVWTPVTNAHLVCRLLLEKKNNNLQKPTNT